MFNSNEIIIIRKIRLAAQNGFKASVVLTISILKLRIQFSYKSKSPFSNMKANEKVFCFRAFENKIKPF